MTARERAQEARVAGVATVIAGRRAITAVECQQRAEFWYSEARYCMGIDPPLGVDPAGEPEIAMPEHAARYQARAAVFAEEARGNAAQAAALRRVVSQGLAALGGGS